MAQINASSGANGGIFNHAQPKNPDRSRFDLSRITNLTADSGMIVPFDWFTTVPGDSFKIDTEISLETLPAVTNVLTPYKVKLHWYYLKMSDLWAGWQTFITKGRDGDVHWRVPQIAFNETGADYGSDVRFSTPHSLMSYIGCPPLVSRSAEDDFIDYLPYAKGANPVFTGYKTGGKFSALPFVAYQNICKYNYVNQNLLQDNHALFPVEGDDEWRLPVHIDNDTTDNVTITMSGKATVDVSAFGYDGIYTSSDTEVDLRQLRYAPFDDDYFTTALPWLQRGNVTTANLDIDFSDVDIVGDGQSYFDGISMFGYPFDQYRVTNRAVNGLLKSFDRDGNLVNINDTSHNFIDFPGRDLSSYSNFASHLSLVGNNVGVSLTANQLRELLAMSVWQERNARVNGSYNSMIWIHYNHNPHTTEHLPKFIGGSSSYVQFGQVLQTSQSSNDSPLGSSAGRGSMFDSASHGRFDCDDFGIIMGIMIVTPMTTYNTSQDHALVAENVQEDFYFPEFEQLSPQPIINREIYPDDTDNDKLFGYQERYSYLKTRLNVNRGLFRLPSDIDNLFSASSAAREFASVPELSYQFVTQSPANTRRDWLALPSEPMFKIQIASKIDATRPLSYTAHPNTFGF